ncbi:MAG: sensor histidine kinase [Acidimicrobiales bacterium]
MSEPQPTLDRLDGLVDQMREAGLDVDVSVDGDIRPLTPGVGLSAYRIVQEALTNTLKHAGPPARTEVVLRFGADRLDVVVLDNGRGPAAADARRNGQPPVNGLIGMRERVSLLGGDLTVGRRLGGGFEVRATFPMASAAPHR